MALSGHQNKNRTNASNSIYQNLLEALNKQNRQSSKVLRAATQGIEPTKDRLNTQQLTIANIRTPWITLTTKCLTDRPRHGVTDKV